MEEVEERRDRYIRTTLREFILYIVFVIVICIMTYSMTSATMYYFTKNTEDLFIDDEITGVHQKAEYFYNYMDERLVPNLYWEKHYNGDAVRDEHLGYVLFESKILCTPRLVQQRVKKDSCEVHDLMKKTIQTCYGSLTESTKETTHLSENKWNYSSTDDGYVQLLGDTKSEALTTLRNLKDGVWVDRGTRLIDFEFTIYNANINLFCIILIEFHFPITGGLDISANINTLKMIRYVTDWDYFVLALEVVFILYLVYYTVEELMEIRVHKWKYFTSGWNVYDIVIIVTGVTGVCCSIYMHFEALSLLKEVTDTGGKQFVDFANLGSKQRSFNETVAVFVLLAWLKLFKYLNFNKTMLHLGTTLKRCAKDVLAFVVMFLIVFLGFACWGFKTFGAQLESFSTFPTTMVTLFRLVLGDFNFDELEEVRPVIGPIYFVSYVLLIFFVLINMFLAIINDTYVAVGEDIEEAELEFDLGNYLSRGYKKMLEKISSSRRKIVDIQTALLEADSNNNNMIEFEEWREKLRSVGHAEIEIESIFCKYDKDGDHILNEQECKEMHRDIARQKADMDKEMEDVKEEMEEGDYDNDGDESDERIPMPKVSTKKFTVLSCRVDRLEHSMGTILSLVDVVMNKMTEINDGIIQRRDTLNRVFDGVTYVSMGRNDGNMLNNVTSLFRDEFSKWDKWGGDGVDRESNLASHCPYVYE